MPAEQTMEQRVLAALPGRALEISKAIGLWGEMNLRYGANGETYINRTSSGQVANVLRKLAKRGLAENDGSGCWHPAEGNR